MASPDTDRSNTYMPPTIEHGQPIAFGLFELPLDGIYNGATDSTHSGAIDALFSGVAPVAAFGMAQDIIARPQFASKNHVEPVVDAVRRANEAVHVFAYHGTGIAEALAADPSFLGTLPEEAQLALVTIASRMAPKKSE